MQLKGQLKGSGKRWGGTRVETLLRHPTYKLRHIIKPESDNDFGIIGVEKTKTIVKLNKPIYCGLTILELSKLICKHVFMMC